LETKVTDNFPNHLVSRRTFLFTLAAVTCFGLSPEVKAANSFAPFSFGYVTDTHVVHGKPDSYLLLQESQLFLQDCIKQLNGEKLDFVIFGGDQVETPGTDDANWQLFVDCAQVLSCPWTFVLGEKDVSGNPPVDKTKLYGPDWKQKGIQTDASYWSQSPLPGVHIIGLDTSRPESTTGDVSNEQLDWLKNDLQKNAGKFTIVFSHHPLLAPPPFDAGPPWDDYITTNGASVREILGGSKDVRLAINGHLHVNKVQQESAIWYVSSSSLDVYPCSYKIFRITPQTIQMETYQISYPALIKKAKVQLDGSTIAFKYNEQKPTAFADLAVGNRIDNMALLPLAPGQPAQPIDEKRLKKAKEEQQKKEQAETAKGDKGKKGKEENKKGKKEESSSEKSKKKGSEKKESETEGSQMEESPQGESQTDESKQKESQEPKKKGSKAEKESSKSQKPADKKASKSSKSKVSKESKEGSGSDQGEMPGDKTKADTTNVDATNTNTTKSDKSKTNQSTDKVEPAPTEPEATPKADPVKPSDNGSPAPKDTKESDSMPEDKAQPAPN
jgi:hypothetical protein